ncbi:MAG: GIY-YIG nuclease family protein [Thiomicrorhabdus chilensis]|uniref:GIY-YIG nuclease family protein n=1 Tax=Thiomicrorhabdus chilensis TaxID=63656 RepID=UPI00299D9D82|nr:GIY-YIG nuclease family protein [Thiomicrorhabdus chilensis]MDX1347451.1 GIY-YIG nuclease family protein [Thiomicrorhabdus chilensis]
MNDYFVYILTSQNNKVMYVGVTNDLQRRIHEHRSHSIPGFTQKYSIDKLVYFESCVDVNSAIAREKQLKGWRREKKNTLVEGANPDWKDLADDWLL